MLYTRCNKHTCVYDLCIAFPGLARRARPEASLTTDASPGRRARICFARQKKLSVRFHMREAYPLAYIAPRLPPYSLTPLLAPFSADVDDAPADDAPAPRALYDASANAHAAAQGAKDQEGRTYPPHLPTIHPRANNSHAPSPRLPSSPLQSTAKTTKMAQVDDDVRHTQLSSHHSRAPTRPAPPSPPSPPHRSFPSGPTSPSR